MKRLLFVICLIMSMLFSYPVQAAVETHQTEAGKLAAMGLLLGTANGFELDSPPSRVQGAVMLVRLLGKEEEAQLSSFSHPFADIPDWADKRGRTLFVPFCNNPPSYVIKLLA